MFSKFTLDNFDIILMQIKRQIFMLCPVGLVLASSPFIRVSFTCLIFLYYDLLEFCAICLLLKELFMDA